MARALPRLVVSALRGGAGKTILAVGLAAAWRRLGRRVDPFKKGPDYIDAAWLGLAAGRPGRNLDSFLMGKDQVLHSFGEHSSPGGLSLIEGNRGLYDGGEAEGSQSTADLAKLLRAPVVLVVDCEKVTRTAAALVLGCQRLDPEVNIRGVILNRLGGRRQEDVVRSAIEGVCAFPVLGAVPRLEDFPFPERHLGLIPPLEHHRTEEALGRAAEVAAAHMALDRLAEIAAEAPPWPEGEAAPEAPPARRDGTGPVIGVIRDPAFQFYYPENLKALADRGARVVQASALEDDSLPPVDALYIGGGFPESHVSLLSANLSFRTSLKRAVEEGLPVYAECGGLMYLGESLKIGENRYPMVGALPVAFGMERRPQGHGYTILEVREENPFFSRGSLIRGHEFHYSRVLWVGEDRSRLAFQVIRGSGLDGRRDGLCRKNVLATYSHLHALGTPEWAEGMVKQAMRYKNSKRF